MAAKRLWRNFACSIKEATIFSFFFLTVKSCLRWMWKKLVCLKWISVFKRHDCTVGVLFQVWLWFLLSNAPLGFMFFYFRLVRCAWLFHVDRHNAIICSVLMLVHLFRWTKRSQHGFALYVTTLQNMWH